MKSYSGKEKSLPLKIMIIIAARSVTGPVKGVFQLIKHISLEDTRCTLYAFRSNGRSPERLLEGAQINNIPVILLEQKGPSYLSLVRQAIREAKSTKIDIIQTHGFKPSVLGFFVHLFCKVPWICFMHGTTSENLKVEFYNLIENLLQPYATRTVLVSKAQRSKIFRGYDTTRVRVLHNAVDLEQPMPLSPVHQPVRKLLGLPSDSRLLVVVGRFSPEKGMDVFIDAVAMLVMDTENIHAVLVGDGQERGQLEKQAVALNVNENVHFVGFTETPGDYVVDADLVVVPSRSEGIPNVVLEAMALGKPVVATAVGGVPEIIEHGVSGYLIPPERPDLLADAIKTVLGDRQMYNRFVVNGRERVKKSFSIRQRVAKLISLYQEVLNEVR